MTRAEALADVLTVLQDGTHWTPAGSLRLFSMADALVALVLRPDDQCPCGREASEAVGDPLQDHEPTCAVYLAAKLDAVQGFGVQQGDRAEQAERHLTVARETIARLNRRCQKAESALGEYVDLLKKDRDRLYKALREIADSPPRLGLDIARAIVDPPRIILR